MLTRSRQLSLACVSLQGIHQCHNVGISCGSLGGVPRCNRWGMRQIGAADGPSGSAVAATLSDGVARSAPDGKRHHDGLLSAGTATAASHSRHRPQHRGQHVADGRSRRPLLWGSDWPTVAVRRCAHPLWRASGVGGPAARCSSHTTWQQGNTQRLADSLAAPAAASASGGTAPDGSAGRSTHPRQPAQHNYAAVVAYDGTGYAGFQMQTKLPGATIQDRLEKAIQRVTHQPRQELRLQAAGRTDSGVHARGQCVSFLLPSSVRMTPRQLQAGINACLPGAIRLLGVAPARPAFSARHSALAKEYHFRISMADVADPFHRKYFQHVSKPLDMKLLRHAAALFQGEHDFTQFANLSPEYRHPVKRLSRCEVVDLPDGFRIEVEGNGFLYKQVRHLVGAMLTAGRGRLTLDAITSALELGSARPPGHEYRGWNIAEPQGLCLMRVDYPGELFHDWQGHELMADAASFGIM